MYWHKINTFSHRSLNLTNTKSSSLGPIPVWENEDFLSRWSSCFSGVAEVRTFTRVCSSYSENLPRICAKEVILRNNTFLHDFAKKKLRCIEFLWITIRQDLHLNFITNHPNVFSHTSI